MLLPPPYIRDLQRRENAAKRAARERRARQAAQVQRAAALRAPTPNPFSAGALLQRSAERSAEEATARKREAIRREAERKAMLRTPPRTVPMRVNGVLYHPTFEHEPSNEDLREMKVFYLKRDHPSVVPQYLRADEEVRRAEALPHGRSEVALERRNTAIATAMNRRAHLLQGTPQGQDSPYLHESQDSFQRLLDINIDPEKGRRVQEVLNRVLTPDDRRTIRDVAGNVADDAEGVVRDQYARGVGDGYSLTNNIVTNPVGFLLAGTAQAVAGTARKIEHPHAEATRLVDSIGSIQDANATTGERLQGGADYLQTVLPVVLPAAGVFAREIEGAVAGPALRALANGSTGRATRTVLSPRVIRPAILDRAGSHLPAISAHVKVPWHPTYETGGAPVRRPIAPIRVARAGLEEVPIASTSSRRTETMRPDMAEGAPRLPEFTPAPQQRASGVKPTNAGKPVRRSRTASEAAAKRPGLVDAGGRPIGGRPDGAGRKPGSNGPTAADIPEGFEPTGLVDVQGRQILRPKTRGVATKRPAVPFRVGEATTDLLRSSSPLDELGATRGTRRARDVAEEAARAGASSRPGRGPGPREIRGGWFSDEAAAAARERLARLRKESGGMYGMIVPGAHKIPEIPDLTILAGNHIRRAGETFGAWADEMVGLFGHTVRPKLPTAWKQAYGHALHEVRTFDAAQIAAIANDPRPRPYAAWKKGPNPSLLSFEDLIPSLNRNGDLVFDVLETDRARADGYHNPVTGARVRADGGIGFPLGVKEHAIVAWENMRPLTAENLQRRSDAAFAQHGVRPVTFTTLNKVENSLKSHGPAILRAELYQARNRGAATEAQLVGHFNKALKSVMAHRVEPASSLHDIKRVFDSISLDSCGRIVRRSLGSRKPFGLPSVTEALSYLNDPALADLPTSAIVSALRVDPFTHGPTADFGVRPHLVYPEGMGGVSLGASRLTNPETLYGFFPDFTTDALREVERNGGGSVARSTNALNRRMVYGGPEKGVNLIPGSELGRLLPDETQPRIQPRRTSRNNRRR